ncbi:hypothetical protein ACFV0R_30145 [Streptomyces sp. NPDC059578]|uniref:hypothetical protein n=1 Tax=unclassified Streptomyces TaxID=2593676 RepID=UPI003666B652
MTTPTLITTWRTLLADPHKTWALFEHGTCVVLATASGDPAGRAAELLAQFGPVSAGSAAGDFGVIAPDTVEGWVVTGHHPDVLTYVAPQEVAEPTELSIGLYGRTKRALDAVGLRIVHLENGRGEG